MNRVELVWDGYPQVGCKAEAGKAAVELTFELRREFPSGRVVCTNNLRQKIAFDTTVGEGSKLCIRAMNVINETDENGKGYIRCKATLEDKSGMMHTYDVKDYEMAKRCGEFLGKERKVQMPFGEGAAENKIKSIKLRYWDEVELELRADELTVEFQQALSKLRY